MEGAEDRAIFRHVVLDGVYTRKQLYSILRTPSRPKSI
jgi:hypothetical protein